MSQNMPPAEVMVSADDVVSLLERQWPGWDRQVVTPLGSGWDNWMFRVGDSLTARLPRRALSVDLVVAEAKWLPRLEAKLPLAVPTPIFLGEPGEGFPWPWTVCRWVDGNSVADSKGYDEGSLLIDLAGFLNALHSPAPPDAPHNPFRSVPLSDKAEAAGERLEKLSAICNIHSLRERWLAAVDAPSPQAAPVWIHGDFHPHNILTDGTRASGVIDFGDMAAGDPAVDLAVVWMLFHPSRHAEFWAAYGSDDEALKTRAEGWAINQGLVYLAHSADNTVMEAVGERTLGHLLAG